VRYRLPRHIDRAACRDHYEMIAPGFRTEKGLISKHFIWSKSGVAGGIYQWQSLKDAKKFYAGPWRKGISERYGMAPDIESTRSFASRITARAKCASLKRQNRGRPGVRARGKTRRPND
jgi:hypothetical protein